MNNIASVADYVVPFCIIIYLIAGYNFSSTVKKHPEKMNRPFRLGRKELPISTKKLGIILYVFVTIIILIVQFILIPDLKK